MKEKKVSIVAHTHWDREWYFSIEDSKLFSTFNFDKVISVLEKDKYFTSFHLDGQTSIIEDYLSLKPNKEKQIKKLVENKKFYIGPWYTQTDSFYVHPESYIKNLYFGIKKANELGGTMKIGYLPDTFGHNIQTPLLMKGFGISDIIFWRGIDDKKQRSPYFNWVSLDGSKLFAINLTHGYGAAKWLKDSNQEWDEKIIPMVDKIVQRTNLDNIILPSGGDQVLIDELLPAKINKLNNYSKKYEFKLNSYEEFIKELKNEIKTKNEPLNNYVGEFRFPKFARVHRTIGSVRYDIKKMSSDLEDKLINKLEPLQVIINDLVDQELVNKETIEYSWKLLLDGHSHDSLGGCNSDTTNLNIINRFKRAENIIDGLINIFKKIITKNINRIYKNDLVIFNYDLKSKQELKTLTLFSKTKKIKIFHNDKEVDFDYISIKNISGGKKIITTPTGDQEVELEGYYKIKILINVKFDFFGYKSFKIVEINNYLKVNNYLSKNSISNDFFELIINKNSIKLNDKKNNQIINDFIQFNDVGNDGDSYDFSPLKDDEPINDIKYYDIKSLKINNDSSIIKAIGEMFLPKQIKFKKRTLEDKVKFIINLKIKIIKDRISFSILINNNVKDHRLLLKINSNINSNDIYTDVPFGYLKRDSNKLIDENWKKYMVEKPVNYFPIINTVFKSEKDKTFVINTKGLKEVSNNKNYLFLTLFNSTGFLGKDNLLWRPNRASGINNYVLKTPNAQLLKELKFEFEILINSFKLSEYKIEQRKIDYLSRIDFYQDQNLNLFMNRLERFELPIEKYKIPKNYEFKQNLKEGLVLSTIYLSHYDGKKVFRINNLSGKNINLNLKEYNLGVSFVDFKEFKFNGKKVIINNYGVQTIKEN